MSSILSGHAQPEQVGALLATMHFRPPTGAMLAGFVRAFRAEAGESNLKCPEAIDVCGTGGDGLGTFNVSTAVAFVVAAAGQSVAKHGNRAVSSRCGSFDVLEALGVPFADTAAEARESLDRHLLAFMYAPSFHPAMRKLVPVRKLLGFRTVFNVLGPLLNPAGVEKQLIGVYSESLVVPVAEALGELGAQHAMVVHGLDGSDEFSVLAPTRVAHLREGRVDVSTFDPASLKLAPASAASLVGGDAQHNARIIREVFDARRDSDSRRDIVALNAAAALVVGDRAGDLKDGLALAQETLANGSVARLLSAMSGAAS